MALNYTTFVQQIANLMVIPSTDANFAIMLPGMIDYAEQRIYREMNLMSTQITDSSQSTTASTRNFTLPTSIGTFIVIDNVNIISSAGASPTTGSRNPTMPVTRDWLDMVYPSGQALTGLPQYFSRIDNATISFGPSPDAAYTVEVTGTQRPAPLASSNSSTFLTAYLPDLFIAASMVFGSGYMRDFGGQSDNPGQAQSWENQYATLFKSANSEELRKSYESAAWTSQGPTPEATPPRA